MPSPAELWRAMGRPEAWLAGGWVRDRLLGHLSHDLDVVVRGDLDRAARCADALARGLGVQPHLLGRPPRSVWRVEHPTLSVEIWALAELSLEDDARRRDFTCNALFWALPDGPVVDLVDGVADLGRRQLRAVHRDNLRDDPIRLLRACRFLARLPTFELEADTATWIAELAPALAHAPRERVGKDLLGLLASPRPQRGLEALIELGLLAPTAPDATADAPWLERRLAAATILGAGRGDTVAPLLALVVRAWGPPRGRRLHAYAWNRELAHRALVAARLLDRACTTAGSGPAERREVLAEAGEAAPTLLDLGSAVTRALGGSPTPWRRWHRQWLRLGSGPPPPLIDGAEVAAVTGLAPGPELGRILTALARAQVRGEVRTAGGARRWLERFSPRSG